MGKVHIRGGSKLRFEFDEDVEITPQGAGPDGKSKKWTTNLDTYLSPNCKAHVRVADVKDNEVILDFKSKT